MFILSELVILILSELFSKITYFFKPAYYIVWWDWWDCTFYIYSDTLFIIQFYSKRYAYVTFDCVYVWSPSSVRHTFRVPGTGFPWDKIQGRGWNIATALIVTALSLVRTSAKQMSHRSRSADAYRRASPV